MAKVSDVNTLNGGMNLDVSKKYMKPEDYSYALNYRNNSAQESSIGVGGNIKGNTFEMNTFTGNYIERIVGSVYDSKRDRTVILGYNDSEGRGYIFYYDGTDDAINSYKYVILVDDDLTFEANERVLNIKIIDDYLIWTDNQGVHFLDIVRMNNFYLFTQGGNINTGNIKSLSYYNYWALEITHTQYNDYIIYNKKIYQYIGTSFQGNPDEFPADYTEIDDYDKVYVGKVKSLWDLNPTPPTTAPSPSYSYDEEYIGNNIIKKQFRFAYKYEYVDGRQSVWSPQSSVPYPSIAEDSQGFYQSIVTNNVIDIVLNTGSANVKKIYIAAIENGITNPKIIDVIDVVLDNGELNIIDGVYLTPDTDFVYRGFYNNQYYSVIDISEFNQSYWYVPDLAEHMELLDDGRLSLFNLTEGFDIDKVNENIFNIESETINPLTDTSIDILTYDSNPESTSYSTGTVDTVASNHDFYEFPSYEIDGVINIDIDFDVNGTVTNKVFNISYKHDYDKTDNENRIELIKLVADTLQSEANKFVSVYSAVAPQLNHPNNNYKLWMFDWGTNTDNSLFKYTAGVIDMDYSLYILDDISESTASGAFSVDITVNTLDYTTDSPKIKTLKANSKYDLGIVYYDGKLKNSGVTNIKSIKTGAYGGSSDWRVDGSVSPATSTYEKRYIEALLNSIPPENAKYWSFAITQNKSVSKSLVIPIEADNAFRCNADFAVNNTGGLYIKVNFSDTILKFIENNQNCQFQDWTFENGDRLRYIGSKQASKKYNYDNYDEIEIVGYDPSSLDLLLPYNSSWYDYNSGSPIGYLTDVGNLFELYRPKNAIDEDDEIYYEIGGLQDILYPGTSNRAHSCNNTDQVVVGEETTTAGVHDLKYGDTFIRRRALRSTDYFIVEDLSWSDYFESDLSDRGRPQFFLPEMKRENRPTLIRYGGKLLPTTNVNNIAEFEYDNSDVLSETFGSINGARMRGYTLVVLQDTKKTSYYIGKDILTKADGSNELIATNKVLNNKRVSEFDYGCINPESIIKRNNDIMWFDAINGCFVRDSANGAFPISKYGIESYSKTLGTQVIDNDKYVAGGYDEFNDEFVWVTDYDSDYGNAITFKSSENKWISFWEYLDVSDNFVSLLGVYRNKLVSFIDNDIYIHDSNSDYNDMFGLDVSTEIEVVINKEPMLVKVFDYISIESNDSWSNTDTDAASVNDGEMESVLTPVKEKEGNYYIEILRDKNSVGSRSETEKIMYGRRLRGEYMAVRLKNQSSNKVVITGVIGHATISERI